MQKPLDLFLCIVSKFMGVRFALISDEILVKIPHSTNDGRRFEIRRPNDEGGIKTNDLLPTPTKGNHYFLRTRIDINIIRLFHLV